MEKHKTMHQEYGEPNDKYGKHLVCPKCGLCSTCADCSCDAENKNNNTQLPEEQPGKGKDARRAVKPEKEKGLVTSERDSGVVDHNLEHPVETYNKQEANNG